MPSQQPTPQIDLSNFPKCWECKRPMRDSRTTAEIHPGTVRAAKDGRCSPCCYPSSKYPQKARPSRAKAARRASTPGQVERDRLAADRFIQSIRGKSAGLRRAQPVG